MSSDFFLLEPCSSANGLEIKFRGRNIDLKKLSSLIEKEGGFSGASTAVVLLAKIDDFEISAYASGRIMIKSKTKNKKQVSEFCSVFAKELFSKGCLI